MHPPLFVNSDAFVNIARLHTHVPLECSWYDSHQHWWCVQFERRAALLSVWTLLHHCMRCSHSPSCLQTPMTPSITRAVSLCVDPSSPVYAMFTLPFVFTNTHDPRYCVISVTATPGAILEGQESDADDIKHNVIRLKPPPTYIGFLNASMWRSNGSILLGC
jgi:hypothetical protein